MMRSRMRKVVNLSCLSGMPASRSEYPAPAPCLPFVVLFLLVVAMFSADDKEAESASLQTTVADGVERANGRTRPIESDNCQQQGSTSNTVLCGISLAGSSMRIIEALFATNLCHIGLYEK